jgi:hypothetical protein
MLVATYILLPSEALLQASILNWYRSFTLSREVSAVISSLESPGQYAHNSCYNTESPS